MTNSRSTRGGIGIFAKILLTHAVLLRVGQSDLGIAVALVEVVAVLVDDVEGEDGVDVAGREVVSLEGGDGLPASPEGGGVGAGGEGHDGSEDGRELHLV